MEIVPSVAQPPDLSPLVPLITKVLKTFHQLKEGEATDSKDRLLAKGIFCQIQIVSQRLRPLTPFFLRLTQPQKKQSAEQQVALTHLTIAIGSTMIQAFGEKKFSLTGRLGRIHEHLAKGLNQPIVENQIPRHPREGTILKRVIERELTSAGIKTPQEISFKEPPQSRLFLVARYEYTQEAWKKGFPPPLRFYLARFLRHDRLNQGIRAQTVYLGEIPHGEKQIRPAVEPTPVREAFIPDRSRVILSLFTR
jgi:hypothetical protein